MLKEQIENYKAKFKNKVDPATASKMQEATKLLQNEEFISNIAKEGDKLPNIELLDHNEKAINLYDCLENRPTIITFYRGTWCPYCNFELKEYADLIGEQKEINMLAISPEKPDIAQEKLSVEALPFKVLSDKDNALAKELKLIFTMPEYLNEIYLNFGIDVDKSQGNTKKELPVPATYVINKDGVIVKSWIDVDYTARAEPFEVINFYKTLI